MMIWSLLTVLAAEAIFPERTPSMIESCLYEALASKTVSKSDEEYKYICAGESAQVLWDYLEKANLEPWEQKAANGVWLSREFPLGGCFKRVRNPYGSAASDGLSCTIWIPYRIKKTR